MTPKLFKKYINAYKRQKDDMDALNHKLGIYIAIGVNNPKKYPEKPYSQTENKQIEKNMSDERMKEKGKQIAIMFGGEVK